MITSRVFSTMLRYLNSLSASSRLDSSRLSSIPLMSRARAAISSFPDAGTLLEGSRLASMPASARERRISRESTCRWRRTAIAAPITSPTPTRAEINHAMAFLPSW